MGERNFWIEMRAGFPILVWKNGSCRSTTQPELELFDANHELTRQVEQLRAFAADVLNEFWEGGMDGADLQDIGEKHGLLIKTEMSERCSEEEGGCSCAEAGADFPTECYRYAPILTAPPSSSDPGRADTGREER